ncbi:hypothetical protein KIH74_30880 [Kineosporia sp. J2-2]|uniref:Uncharacterized protein n=1 Tax=Kineosporia corallincola TaxID=2835133 RepID=A0ABS5TRG9_9ACTN|nr:hypothetical protein [Kineosporia corallincola]MBT0773391.1 hypothetical protein [Kineosporia corallincola]
MTQRVRTAFAVIAGLVVVGCCAGLVVMIERGHDPAQTASVVQGYVAPIAVAVSLLGALATWWLSQRQGVAAPGALDAAAGQLRGRLRQAWRREARARGIELPAPVTVRWRWADGDLAGPREEIAVPAPPGLRPVTLGSPGVLLDEGSVTSLHD